MWKRALSALAAMVITAAIFYLFLYQPKAPVTTEVASDVEAPLSFFEVSPHYIGQDFWSLLNEMK